MRRAFDTSGVLEENEEVLAYGTKTIVPAMYSASVF